MAEPLYYRDPYCHHFSASIVGRRIRADGSTELALDRTAFYPEGGGQPADRGRIGESNVVHVYKQDGEIWHVIDDSQGAVGGDQGAVGGDQGGADTGAQPLNAEIDWTHRFDYMQQHTGQHILSATFLRVAGLETVSVHQGAEYTTIEFDAKDLDADTETEIEDRANTVIAEARRVHAFWCEESEIPALALRRPPKVSGSIRIVEIDDYDRVACGGVHTATTSEVSLVRILGRERIRGRLRYAFLIGARAHEHHRAARDTLSEIGDLLSVPPLEAAARVRALDARVRDLEYERNGLKQKIARTRADGLAQSAEPIPAEAPGERLWFVRELSEGDDPADLRKTAEALSEHRSLAFALATKSEKGLVWIVGCGPDVSIDVKELKQRAFAAINAKGGGKPPLFQGKGDSDGDWVAFTDGVRACAKKA
ncbi:MAG: alanyl-tRNA editing protein [Spirochaetales bacterium]